MKFFVIRFLPRGSIFLLSAALLSHAPLSFAGDWLVFSGLSHHFKRDERNWRESNPGIGMERESKEYQDLFWTGGYFRNSYDRHTVYLGARWMPYRIGPFVFGGYALAATGYPSPVLVLPGMAIEGKKVGVNIVAAPNVFGHSGYIGAQFRFRLR